MRSHVLRNQLLLNTLQELFTRIKRKGLQIQARAAEDVFFAEMKILHEHVAWNGLQPDGYANIKIFSSHLSIRVPRIIFRKTSNQSLVEFNIVQLWPEIKTALACDFSGCM